jgi:hypothetical protein
VWKLTLYGLGLVGKLIALNWLTSRNLITFLATTISTGAWIGFGIMLIFGILLCSFAIRGVFIRFGYCTRHRGDDHCCDQPGQAPPITIYTTPHHGDVHCCDHPGQAPPITNFTTMPTAPSSVSVHYVEYQTPQEKPRYW